MKYENGDTKVDDNEEFIKYIQENLTEIRDCLLHDPCSRDQTYKACYTLGVLMATIDLNLKNDW